MYLDHGGQRVTEALEHKTMEKGGYGHSQFNETARLYGSTLGKDASREPVFPWACTGWR
ncbi:hypothetical protein ACRRTK_009653 [Alexandromys fortis]